jgi:hypothetical protein
MEMLTKAAWGLLVLIHCTPAAVVFSPSLTTKLYGVDATSAVGVLLVHRGALFLAIVAAGLFALFDPDVRRACSVILAISMIGYLVVYAQGGLPPGPLRQVAFVDLAGLIPLGFAAFMAWAR